MKRFAPLKITLMALAFALVCGCALAGCSSDNTEAALSGTAATVNGEDISEQTVADRVDRIRVQSGLSEDDTWGKFLVANSMTGESVRSTVIDTLVEEAEIRQGAADLGIETDEDKVNESIASFKENYETDEDWKDALERVGLTESSYHDLIAQSMVEEQLIDHFKELAEVTDEDYVTAAQTYASSYNGAMRASVIVFNLEEDEAAEPGDESADAADGESESAAAEEPESSSAEEDEGAEGEPGEPENGADNAVDASDESEGPNDSESESAESADASEGDQASDQAAGDEANEANEAAEDADASTDASADSDSEDGDSAIEEDPAYEAIRAEAQRVHDLIESGELDFADAAKQYSDDEETADKGGDLGWNTLSQFPDDYNTALSTLENGQMSEPISTDAGYFIIKVTDQYTAPEDTSAITSLDDIPEDFRDNIKEMAESVKANELYSAWLDGVKDDADVQINDMPEGLPYDIDLTEYQEEADAKAAEEEAASTDESTDAATTDSVETAEGDTSEASEAADTGESAEGDASENVVAEDSGSDAAAVDEAGGASDAAGATDATDALAEAADASADALLPEKSDSQQ